MRSFKPIRRAGTRAVTTVLPAICLSLVMVVVAAKAQDQQAPRAKHFADSARARQTAAAQQAARDGKPNPGWLILDGRLVRGPYAVSIEDSIIMVNGHAINSPSVTLRVIPRDPDAPEITDLDGRFWVAFRTWHSEEGIDSARQKALRFMEAEPLVEKAFFQSSGVLSVQFRGKRFPCSFLLDPPAAPPISSESTLQRLRAYAEALQDYLAHGSLVIMHDGGMMVTPPPQGQSTFEKLRNIVSAYADPAKRLAAIKEIVHDERAAQLISERFLQE